MTMNISPEAANRFQSFGTSSSVQEGGAVRHPEQISIGNGILLQAPYLLEADHAEGAVCIQIGDGCQLGPGIHIDAEIKVLLEQKVLIDPNVYISDRISNQMGIEVLASLPGNDATPGQITIGEGTWIGANSIILGNLRIGAGTVIKPNSVVVSDIPDYCVASGIPAVITEIYDVNQGIWISVSGQEEAQKLLEERRLQPLLSICIPTFNRAPHLEHILNSIFSQIGHNSLVEVIVSDNASTDGSYEIANRYAALYSNMSVLRNPSNLGADPNMFRVMNAARGKFVKLQGDDDFYVKDSIYPLLNDLHNHRDCGVIQVFVRNNSNQVVTGTGMQSYLASTSLYAAFISAIILRREDLERIEEPGLFLQSSFNQLYLQYAILEKNPKYCIINRNIFTYAGIPSDDYSFGEVILRNYQSILKHFVGRGFTMEDVDRERKNTLFGYAIPVFGRIVQTNMVADTEGFEDLVKELYEKEDYFDEAWSRIMEIRPPQVIDSERSVPMPETISSQLISELHQFGSESYIHANGQIDHPQAIAIGNDVTIDNLYWLHAIRSESDVYPKIIIGDGCKSEKGLSIFAHTRIELERNIMIGSHVYITDTDRKYQEVGKPILEQGLNKVTTGVFIGEGVTIGSRAVICGDVRIGKGSIIEPGTLVEEDVPEHCIAKGVPAICTPIESNLLDQTDLEDDAPLLSICIPTYNRAANLDHCLHSIFSQMDNIPSIEILVSDNASTDNTREVVERYAAHYPLLKYSRNETNIGADRNIYHVIQQARGKFIKLQGDDDYWENETLAPFIEVVKNHMDCGIIHISVHSTDDRVYRGHGAAEFLEATSIMAAFITGIVLRREDLEKVVEPERFLNTSCNQMYLQYSILMNNPVFCVVNRSMFYFQETPPSGYNFGKVVFEDYQSILKYFIGKGLTEEQFRAEKKKSLYKEILPWFTGIVQSGFNTDVSGFTELFSKHYQDEPYYQNALNEIKAITTSNKN